MRIQNKENPFKSSSQPIAVVEGKAEEEKDTVEPRLHK